MLKFLQVTQILLILTTVLSVPLDILARWWAVIYLVPMLWLIITTNEIIKHYKNKQAISGNLFRIFIILTIIVGLVCLLFVYVLSSLSNIDTGGQLNKPSLIVGSIVTTIYTVFLLRAIVELAKK